MKTASAMCLLMGSLFISHGCAYGQSTLRAKKDSILVIELNAALAEGYSWEIAKLDTANLKVISVKDISEDKGIGANSIQKFSIMGIRRGTYNLELVYWRPWLKDKTPKAEHKKYSITIY